MNQTVSSTIGSLLAYVVVIGVATWGFAHLVGGGPRSTPSTCVTAGIRPLGIANLRGTGQVCAVGALAQVNLTGAQLRPGGTYTILLVDDSTSSTTCATACSPGEVRVVDTANADQFGGLEINQKVPLLDLSRASTVRLQLLEFVRQQPSQLNDVAFSTVGRHRVDRLPDEAAEVAVAKAVFVLP